jgi:hypothetical protein
VRRAARRASVRNLENKISFCSNSLRDNTYGGHDRFIGFLDTGDLDLLPAVLGLLTRIAVLSQHSQSETKGLRAKLELTRRESSATMLELSGNFWPQAATHR